MLEEIKHQLMGIFDTCRNLTEKQILESAEDVFLPHLEILNQLATVDIDDRHVETLMDDSSLKPAIEKIARFKQVHGLRMERQRAGMIIDSETPWDMLQGFIYYPNYLGLAEMESRGVGLKAADRVVFLGAGPLPLSLIALVKRCGIQGVGIEKDPVNADLSRKVLATLDLSRQIDILQGDHFLLPLSRPCRLVMVGADAVPKDEIFTHLAGALPGKTKLSFRMYEKGLRRLFDMDHIGELPHPLKEYRRIRPQPPVNNTSVFVVKENDHA